MYGNQTIHGITQSFAKRCFPISFSTGQENYNYIIHWVIQQLSVKL